MCANACSEYYELYVSKCSVLRVCVHCSVCVQDLWSDGGEVLWEGLGGGGRGWGQRGGGGALDVACCRHKGGLIVNTHSGSSGSAAGSPANKPFIKAV